MGYACELVSWAADASELLMATTRLPARVDDANERDACVSTGKGQAGGR